MQKISIKRKEVKHTWFGIGVIFLIWVAILLPPISFNASAEPPDDHACISYAYTESLDHSFLLKSDKKVFGNNVTIIHNCEYISVYIDGNFSVYTEEKMVNIPIMVGLHSIEITSFNHTNSITNFTVFPDRLNWQLEYYEWQNDINDFSFERFISVSEATAKANWASILSILMVFTLVTVVYWNLINTYIDKNYCEEVKE